jgi:hypothetical protein
VFYTCSDPCVEGSSTTGQQERDPRREGSSIYLASCSIDFADRGLAMDRFRRLLRTRNVFAFPVAASDGSVSYI